MRPRSREPMNSSTKWPNLLPGGPGYREGRIQRQIRRLLLVESVVTTKDMMAVVWLREPWTEWRWRHVRASAERYAERIGKRSRPLRWRLKSPSEPA